MSEADDILFMIERVEDSDHRTIASQSHHLLMKLEQVALISPAFQRFAMAANLYGMKNLNSSVAPPSYSLPKNLDQAKSDAFLIFRSVVLKGDVFATYLFHKGIAESHSDLMHIIYPYFKSAVEDIITDLRASGKWSMLEGKVIDQVGISDEESPFPPEHRPAFIEALRATEDRILAAVQEHHGATQYGISLSDDIRRQVRSIDTKIDKIGRKDMILLVLGLLFSIAASAAVTPEAIRAAAITFIGKIKAISVSLIA